MTKDEALKLALEVLNDLAAWNDGEVGSHMDEPYAAEVARITITTIEQALAQPAVMESHKQEPWVCECKADSYLTCKCAIKSPPQRPSRSDIKPLTAMEVYDVVHDADLDWHTGFALGEDENRFVVFARAIEAAHGIYAPTERKGEA